MFFTTDGGKDVTVTTDDFSLDQVERSQRHRTRWRRDHRSRRRQLFAFGSLALILALGVGAPSLLSHSSIGRSMLVGALAEYGLDSKVDSVRIGWVTPLRVTGLQIHGTAGSEMTIDQIDMDITVSDLVGSSRGDMGQIAARGVMVACQMSEGRCSLEDDLQTLLQPSEDESTNSAALKLQDVSVAVTDTLSGGTWQVTQSNADVDITGSGIKATFAGVLTEPGGSGGSLQGSIDFSGAVPAADETASGWRLDINSESLPLSVVSLIRRRFPEMASAIPRTIHGDATGAVLVVGKKDGATEASMRGLKKQDSWMLRPENTRSKHSESSTKKKNKKAETQPGTIKTKFRKKLSPQPIKLGFIFETVAPL
jgi:translocation and assembly module TamB